jgi:hypothetical protein
MIFVSAISSFPRRRESRREDMDSRLRGNDVYVVAECMIKVIRRLYILNLNNEWPRSVVAAGEKEISHVY